MKSTVECMGKCLGLKCLSLEIVVAHERCAEIRKREEELKRGIFASVYAP
jgi:hypothetical protein